MRVLAREAALQLLFSNLFDNPAGDEEKKAIYKELKLDEKASTFASSLHARAQEGFERYMNEISALTKSYSIDRIFAVDKCALILAISEMEEGDVPPAVVINEWVNIVRRYSTENSVNFVNGILAAYNTQKEKKNV